MQRENLYNLQKTAYFIIALFVFKMNKILRDQFLTMWKRYFLVQDKFIFSYWIFLSSDIFYLRKTKYITRYSVQSSTIYKVKLTLIVYFLFSKKNKILCNQLSLTRKSNVFLISYIKETVLF